MTEWFEDEDFWRELYPFMFPDARIDEAVEQIDKIVDLIGFGGGAVLDLCCGPGRHTAALAARGYAVTAVDRTPFLMVKAQERVAAAGLDVEWVHSDMRDFARPAAFDLALNLFTSFGYFDDKDEDLKVLENLHASLKPGGVCVMELAGKEWLARVFAETTSEELADGSLLIQRHEIFDDWTRIRNEWILIRDGRARSFKFHHTLYSGQELEDRFLQTGFAEVELFGGLDGRAYDNDATRLVVVARKAR